MKKASLKPALVLAALILFYGINNFIWLKNDSRHYGRDNIEHITNAVKYHIQLRETIEEDMLLHTKIIEILRMTRNFTPIPTWPPFMYTTAAVFNPTDFSIFRTRFFVNMFLYVILILSLYFFTKKFYGRITALTAAFLISFYPVMYVFSRNFKFDYGLTSFFALALALWAYSDNFSNRGYSILLGLTIGVASLIKIQAAFFMLVPLGWSLYKIIISRPRRLSLFINFSTTLLLGAILFYSWWGNMLPEKASMGLNFLFYRYEFLRPFLPGAHFFHRASSAFPLFSFKNFIYYPFYFMGFTSFPLFALFLVSLSRYLSKIKSDRLFFTLNLLIPYLLFTAFAVKAGRNLLPTLIFVSIITAWFITQISNKKIQKTVMGLTIFYSLTVYLLTSWVLPNYGRFFYYPLPSSYYLKSSHTPYSLDNDYKILFPISWPLDHPLKPGKGIENIKNSPEFEFIRNKIERGEDIIIKFKLSELMAQWGYRDLWKRFALYVCFQDDIVKQRLRIREIREPEWDYGTESFLKVFTDGDKSSDITPSGFGSKENL